MRAATNTHHPKLNEVLEVCRSYKKTVEQRVGQELHKELVVGESHAVVHPEEGKKNIPVNREWSRLPEQGEDLGFCWSILGLGDGD